MENKYQITIWDEFKRPLSLLAVVLLLVLGLHNTFYTFLCVDKSKVDVAWSEEVEIFKPRQIAQQPVHTVAAAPQVQRVAVVEDKVSYQVAAVEAPEAAPNKENDFQALDKEISVTATEFYHPKLGGVVNGTMVNGYLEVQNGEVKGLSVMVNSDTASNLGLQAIQTGESQIQGNIFTYDIDGRTYTATVYPTSPGEYMVSFVNGPWNGARVKFASHPENDGNEAVASEENESSDENINNNVENQEEASRNVAQEEETVNN